MGLKVRAYDTASGVGGTWYWNRYPGARFDSQARSISIGSPNRCTRHGSPASASPHRPRPSNGSTS
ncbi:hypothetical protein [Methylibium sp. T29]|uniref:hypothetical protein n=1 Tax=Methylibium sp. T29 TaxID=1430884 RepID=UPI0020A64EF5|nr:hypothetical protein [Methylibium sp. T29]